LISWYGEFESSQPSPQSRQFRDLGSRERAPEFAGLQRAAAAVNRAKELDRGLGLEALTAAIEGSVADLIKITRARLMQRHRTQHREDRCCAMFDSGIPGGLYASASFMAPPPR
jgi:hypothetical protein